MLNPAGADDFAAVSAAAIEPTCQTLRGLQADLRILRDVIHDPGLKRDLASAVERLDDVVASLSDASERLTIDARRIFEAAPLAVGAQQLVAQARRLDQLTGDIEAALRLVDTQRFLAALDERLATLDDQRREFAQIDARVKRLLTRLESEPSTAELGQAIRRSLAPWAAILAIALVTAVFLIR